MLKPHIEDNENKLCKRWNQDLGSGYALSGNKMFARKQIFLGNLDSGKTHQGYKDPGLKPHSKEKRMVWYVSSPQLTALLATI